MKLYLALELAFFPGFASASRLLGSPLRREHSISVFLLVVSLASTTGWLRLLPSTAGSSFRLRPPGSAFSAFWFRHWFEHSGEVVETKDRKVGSRQSLVHFR